MNDLPTEHEIMRNWKNCSSKPIASICCTAYNHEQFIEKTLEGFLIQKTDFVFEIIIHDDASTDKTPNIIRKYEKKYPKLIKAIYQKENKFSIGLKPMAGFVIPRATGKYIAICEGDDFWIKDNKLQKQVDFLETNPEYGMVSTDGFIIDENGRFLSDNNKPMKNSLDVSFFDLLHRNRIGTLTTCIRTNLMKTLTNRVVKENLWFTYDYWMWLQISIRSKIRIFNDKTACYRSHQGGISKSQGFFNAKKQNFLFFDVIKTFDKLSIGPFNKNQKELLLRSILGVLRKKVCPLSSKIELLKMIPKYDPFLLITIKLIITKMREKKSINISQ
jgi:glycosyltransferase involved in cell wall biosynthesis